MAKKLTTMEQLRAIDDALVENDELTTIQLKTFVTKVSGTVSFPVNNKESLAESWLDNYIAPQNTVSSLGKVTRPRG